MNRGGSSDSIDNGIAYIISSSSSATDFSSDEDLSELYMSCGQPTKSKHNSERNSSIVRSHTRNLNDKFLQVNHLGIPLSNPLRSTHHNVLAPTDRQILTHPRVEFGRNVFNDRFGRDPTTSFSDNTENSNRLGGTGSLLNDHLSHILPEETYSSLNNGIRQINTTTTNSSVRTYAANRRAASTSQNRAAADSGDNCHPSSSTYEAGGLDFNREVTGDENADLFQRAGCRIIDPHIPAIAGPSRQVNQSVDYMCSRLVACRTLSEAMRFIEDNRDLIENETRIIREAPSFRNYDMSNYQIDYSVKDSFNPEFWSDREPVITTADGNCQYHAVSISLTGSESYTQEVRLLTAVAVIDNRDWFDSILKIIDGGTVLDLVHTIARSYSWGDATTLKAVAVAIKRRIFLYTCNIGKKDYEMVKSLSKDELLVAFQEKKYRGGTGIHTYADPLCHVPASNYIMLFHKSEHFIAVLPTAQNPTMFEPYNPIVPTFS